MGPLEGLGACLARVVSGSGAVRWEIVLHIAAVKATARTDVVQYKKLRYGNSPVGEIFQKDPLVC